MERCQITYIITASLLIITILILLAIFLAFWLTSTDVTASRDVLIIDHDGGGDDAMAIFMALLYEEYFNGPKVAALTTVHGNVDEEQAFNNSQRILDIAKRRDVPIFRGSKSALVVGTQQDHYFGYDGLGDNETVVYKPIPAKRDQAAVALINLSKKYEGQLTIVAIGALTNIALAIRLDCDFFNRLSHIYVGAGHIYSDDFTKAEFNARMDVEAYHIVASEGDPEKLTILPFSQILSYINISNEWRKDILGSIPTDVMRAQNVFEQVSLPKDKSWSLLDPAVMAVALNATSFVKETSYSKNDIYLCGEKRGINSNFFTSKCNATAEIVTALDEDSLKKFLFDVFSAPLN